MIDYKNAPAVDEIEVTLFGPGFGEAIAVHLGQSEWLLVDSCIDPSSKKPAAETYLHSIGVQPSCVKGLVASHWHDDHVRGFGRLAEIYPEAELNISSVFSDKEALVFLAAYSGLSVPTLTRGTGEVYRALLAKKEHYHLHQRSIVLERNDAHGSRYVRVTAMSPVQATVSSSMARLAQYIPTGSTDENISHAPTFSPNIEAVVIHIDWNGEAVLLGSDLEEHTKYGWSALLEDSVSSKRAPASLYKVAHHGSASGDHPNIWKDLLAEQSIACLTPFNNGRHKLPNDSDRERVRGLVKSAFIASGATRKPDLESEKLKRLGDICTDLSRVNAGFGATRFRKVRGDAEWRVELFGTAGRL